MKRAIVRALVRVLLFVLALWSALLMLKPVTGFMNAPNSALLLAGLAVTMLAWLAVIGFALFYVLPSLVELWRLIESWLKTHTGDL